MMDLDKLLLENPHTPVPETPATNIVIFDTNVNAGVDITDILGKERMISEYQCYEMQQNQLASVHNGRYIEGLTDGVVLGYQNGIVEGAASGVILGVTLTLAGILVAKGILSAYNKFTSSKLTTK